MIKFLAKDSKTTMSHNDNLIAANPIYRHMNVDKIIDQAKEKLDTTNWETAAGFSSGMIITPSGVKFDGRLQNFMYRDVTVHRYDNEKYRHYFELSNMLGDKGCTDKISAITITNKNKHKDYVLHYATRMEGISDAGRGEIPQPPDTFNAITLYIEISPWSNVNLHEHVWKDSACKIFRIVYLVREGADLTLHREFKSGFTPTPDVKQVIESRIIQHPASKVNVKSSSYGTFDYIQDLFFVKAYKKTTTNITNRYVVNNKQSVHSIADVEHIGEEGKSEVDVKSITNDTSKFTFAGNIKVLKEAEKVDANLQNKNLQLSDTAVVVTEPKLDISTKEIACTHGCTVSSVDPEQLYLLNTRGFDNDRAKEILTEAFLNE